MNISFRTRLVLFALVLTLLIGVIGWAAYTSLVSGERLRQRFTEVQIQSFRIADRLQASAHQLDDTFLKYLVSGKPSDLEHFRQMETTLDQWVKGRAGELTTPKERQVLASVERGLDEYLATAEKVAGSAEAKTAQPLERFSTVQIASQKLLARGADLAQAHQSALEHFLSETQRSLLNLQIAICAALALLTGLGIWGGVVVYRDMIAPMRVELVESRGLIERQEKLASLGVLAAGVAHEIRNPLTAIKARLYTQRKLLAPESRELRDAEFIGHEIDRLERIVRDFLLFARPSDPVLAEVEPAQLLREVCDLLGAQLAEAHVEIRIAETTAQRFTADAAQIKQVLINLVQNASESMSEGGHITLRATPDRIALAGQMREVVVIEVQDDGAGIPLEVRKRLFDPFFTTKQTGTGLGLAVSARIVEKHGGALRFQSQVQRGTTFGIVLPAQS